MNCQPRASYQGPESQLANPEAQVPAGVFPGPSPGSSIVPTLTMLRRYRRSRWAACRLNIRMVRPIVSSAQPLRVPQGLWVT